jgi:hypothetical protein
MHSTYHLASAQDMNNDIVNAIKTTFKSKSITIIVEEDEDEVLTNEMKNILEQRLNEDPTSYISAQNTIEHLNKKYGL